MAASPGARTLGTLKAAEYRLRRPGPDEVRSVSRDRHERDRVLARDQVQIGNPRGDRGRERADPLLSLRPGLRPDTLELDTLSPLLGRAVLRLGAERQHASDRVVAIHPDAREPARGPCP